MKVLIAAGMLAALIAVPSASRAEEITRFKPLKAEELTPPQKAYADLIAAPPRNAKFGNPPYRAYIRNPPSWRRSCRLCRNICAGTPSCRRA